MMMPYKSSTCYAVLFLLPLAFCADDGFVFNGFNGSTGWAMGGSAAVLPNGVLNLALENSHAFYSSPFLMCNLSDGSIFSFSATFAFLMFPSDDQSPFVSSTTDGDGIAFVLVPNTSFSTVPPSNFGGSFGLLGPDDNGNPSNHLLCVELDTSYNTEFDDIDNNHVGININGMNSSMSSPAGYYTDDPFSDFHPMQLSSGKEMQVWIDYDHGLKQLNVSLAPILKPKPKQPLLAHKINLSQVFLDHMYVGFSASSCDNRSYFILGCSFKVNGKAATFNYSKLPKVNATQLDSWSNPLLDAPVKRIKFVPLFLTLVIPVGTCVLLVAVILVMRRFCKYREIREDWELEFGPHRFSYKDLYHATDGFKEKLLLGAGGFGKVYKGVLPSTKTEVAVKVMSHDSKQGMKEFIAEVVSMGRLRHRNLVQLLGYCRRKGEFLVVYEYMPNGSLDKHLYDREKPSLDWTHRFEIIKGVASGLLYLHEEWEQVVIHRDVKAGNVLLDEEMNAQLGDFGLARLHDHGAEALTTRVAGTRGYISPELARFGKATKATDVFAFGAFILEVACGRRPIAVNSFGEHVLLVDSVLKFWQNGLIVCSLDPRLGGEYVEEEAELVLKLGLLCSHLSPVCRPSMRLIMQYLYGDAPFPDMPDVYLNIRNMNELHVEDGVGEDDLPCPSVQTSITGLSGGR